MKILPVPDLTFPDIYAIDPQALRARGLALLLLDVDNTLSPYTSMDVPASLRSWVRDMQQAGLTLYIVSNNRGSRPAHFARALGIPYIKCALKPFPKRARAVMEQLHMRPQQTAVLGDQIYTDTLCARLLGVTAILVEPIHLHNPLLQLRYVAETPFRAMGKRRMRRQSSGH